VHYVQIDKINASIRIQRILTIFVTSLVTCISISQPTA